jgi:hypothetical protein
MPEYTEEQKKVLGILQDNKQKNFVKRILKPDKYPNIQNDDGSVSSHRMEYAEVDGMYIVYPTIIQEKRKGELRELQSDSAIDYALETGEFIEFDSEEDAAWFSGDNGYKSIWK